MFLTPKIVREQDVPSIFHSELKNFDLLVNTMSGTDSVHTVHGIMLKEVLSDATGEHTGSVTIVSSQPRTQEHTLNIPVQRELPGCYVGQRKYIQQYIKCYQIVRDRLLLQQKRTCLL